MHIHYPFNKGDKMRLKQYITILKCMKDKNMLIGHIAKKAKMEFYAVSTCIKELQKYRFVKKYNLGLWGITEYGKKFYESTTLPFSK